MVENNQKASNIVADIWKEKRDKAMFYLSLMVDQNIRGEQIVLAFKKAKSIEALCKALECADHTLIEYINSNCTSQRARYR